MLLKVMLMAVLPIRYCLNAGVAREKQKGLTLIEVLIALAIMSIAMTAIIKATTQNIRSTAYLQNKMMATWVGKYVMNEARLGLIVLPKSSQPVKEKMTLLDRDWYWQAQRDATPNKRIDKIAVDVFEREDDETASPLVSLESYIYHEPS